MNISSIAKSLGGAKRNGDGWICRCPVHKDQSPSLSIRGMNNGGIVVHCFTGCDWKEVKDEIKKRGLIDSVPITRDAAPVQGNKKPIQNLSAVRLWSEAIPAENTLAEEYLRKRGYNSLLPGSLRYHSHLKHPNGNFYPGIVAAVAIHPYKEIFSVHRIFLNNRAEKIQNDAKLSLGPIKGGCVRLTYPFDTIVLTEGIETGLVVMEKIKMPVWCCLSAGGLESVKLPPQIKRVLIYADNDIHSRGEQAAKNAARRFARYGKEVEIHTPSKIGTDYNDYFNANSS